DRGLVVQDLNGKRFLAYNKEQAGRLQTQYGLVEQARDAANTMRTIANKAGTEKIDPTSPLGMQFKEAQERFRNSYNRLQEQGMTRQDDLPRFNDFMGGAYGLATAKNAESLSRSVANS